jgi:hypothetical protein
MGEIIPVGTSEYPGSFRQPQELFGIGGRAVLVGEMNSTGGENEETRWQTIN